MNSFILILALLFITSCASKVATRVLPQEDGTNVAISTANDESVAAIASVKRANRFCKSRGAEAVFIDEKAEYQGVLTARGARTVKNVPVLGKALTSKEDFQVTTKFRCMDTSTSD